MKKIFVAIIAMTLLSSCKTPHQVGNYEVIVNFDDDAYLTSSVLPCSLAFTNLNLRDIFNVSSKHYPVVYSLNVPHNKASLNLHLYLTKNNQEVTILKEAALEKKSVLFKPEKLIRICLNPNKKNYTFILGQLKKP